MRGSENSGRRGSWVQRRQNLIELLEREVARISAAEGRSKAEVERLLLLMGIRAYTAGAPLNFRKEVPSLGGPASRALRVVEPDGTMREIREG